MCVCSSVVTVPKSRDASPECKKILIYRGDIVTAWTNWAWVAQAQGRFCKLWLLIGRDSVSKAMVFTTSCLLYWFVGGQGLSCWKKDYKELYCYPSLSFPLNFLSVTSLPPVTHRPGLSFPVQQVSLASGCYPFLDSHNRKKTGQLNRFCVLLLWALILFSGCFVIVIALKTPFFLICALRLYRRLFSLSLLV